jgi:hypothetical protein
MFFHGIVNQLNFFSICVSYYLLMFKFINCLVNYGVVLKLGVVSLMAGSTTGVPMFPGYGGYISTTLPCRASGNMIGWRDED